MQKIPIRLTVVAAAVSVMLSGCGGGGGSNPYLAPNPGPSTMAVNSGSTTVAPTRLGTVKLLSGTSTTVHESAMTAYDIDGTGGEELIIAGRANLPDGTAPADWKDAEISIWGWQNGTLIDKSAQWFGAGVSRTVIGVEEQVLFGDFDGDGHRDMYAGPYTDITSVRAGQAGANTGAIFFNSGSSTFNQRADVALSPTVSAHASVVADINGDGIDDVWSSAGAVSGVVLGSRSRNLTYLDVAGLPQAGGAGIAVADFTAVGTKSVIFTDQGSAPAANNLYSYAIDLANNRINVTHLQALPTPRFDLPRWSGLGFGSGGRAGHEVRVLADIQLSTGRTASSQNVVSDAVIFSRPNQYANGQWPAYQEIQMLQNNGSGMFTDITDTVVRGFVHDGQASYTQTFKDINNDGRLDIIIPGNSWDNNKGAQVLIWQSAGNVHGFQYQSYYNVALTAMQDNALAAERAINNTAGQGANGVALIRDPSGNFFIATAIDFISGGARQKAIYMTALNSLTPLATVAALRANWPWLNDTQIQTILAQSTTTYLGMNLLDADRALNPQGQLVMPTANGLRPISGTVSGISLGEHAQSLITKDAMGRAYEMDFTTTNLHTVNAWASRFDQSDDDLRGTVIAPNLRFDSIDKWRFGASPDNTTQVFGMTAMRLGASSLASWQFTRMPRSPWISMSGSWGTVKSSTQLEGAISWHQQGWRARAGAMHSVTDIDPGLITRVNPITAVWADLGYTHLGWTVSAGTLPYIIAGSVDAVLPTGVDNRGQIKYNQMRVGLTNPMVGFARLAYQGHVTKRIMVSAGGMISTQDSHTIKMEIKSAW